MNHSRWPLRIAVAASLFGLALRVGVAERQVLWIDEVFSLAIATGHSMEQPASISRSALGDYVEPPLPVTPATFRAYAQHESPPCRPWRVVRAVFLSDTNPPLYYLLLHAWTRVLGTSDLALRSMSMLWAAACLPLLWRLGKELGGPRTAAGAVVLFSFAPVSVYYSTEGRMYSLVWFFTACLALLTYRLHRRGVTHVTLGLWILASAGGLLTHYFFAFAWAALVAWLLVFNGRSKRAWIAVGITGVFLAIVPWYVQLPESYAGWRVSKGWLEMRPGGHNPRTALVKYAWSYVSASGTWWSSAAWTPGSLLPNVLLALCFAAAFLLSRRRFLLKRRVIMLYAWVIGPLLGPLTLDLVGRTYMVAVPRYALAGMCAAFLILALVLRHARRPANMILLGAIVFAWICSTIPMFTMESRVADPFGKLGRLISSRAGESDLVLVHSLPGGVVATARYVAEGCDLDRSSGMISWVERLGVRRVEQDMERLIRGKRRALLVRVHDIGQSAPEEDWLRRNARSLGEDRLVGASVLYFAPREGSTFPESPEPLLSGLAVSPTSPGGPETTERESPRRW